MSEIKRMVLWAVVIALLLSAVSLFVLFRFYLPPKESRASNAPFTIGTWEGQVAVFERGQDFPRQVFEVYVNALPEEQRRRVLEGIPVEDETRLSILLEDYTG